MSRSVQTDTEKKIAEIREAAEEARKTKGSWVDGKDYADDAKFLLDELDRLRAERDSERDKLIEGLRKLAKTNAENISEIREWKAKQNDPEVTDLDWYNYVARDILREIGVMVE